MPVSIDVDAVYGLCSERLTAESLGAMHVNVASFTVPVLGDLAIGKQSTEEWVHYLSEVEVPDLTFLSMTHVARIRRDLSDAFCRFSRATMRVLAAGNGDVAATKALIEDMQDSATALKKEIESALARFAASTRLPNTTVVLGSGGQQGGISNTVDFLLSGEPLTDLKRLITGNETLEFRADSFWAGSS